MEKSATISSIILGASIGFALLKFFNLPQEEKDAFYTHVKNTTNELLDDAENTVEKVEHFMEEFKSKPDNAWMEKLYVLKKMLLDFYGRERKYLL